MSRIGNLPIEIPGAVKVAIEGTTVKIEGPKGKSSFTLPPEVAIKQEDAKLVLTNEAGTRRGKAMHGLSRSLIANHVQGVSEGFVKKLEIHGVGFRAAVQGGKLNLNLGYSHPINYPVPEGIKIAVEEQTKITIEGSDKQLVGAVAADIRSFYPPEPYKGKGVRFAGEQIRRKEGKTAQGK